MKDWSDPRLPQAGRRIVLLLLLLALQAGAAGPVELLPGVDGKWWHYQSTNFELYSHNGESESRNLLHDLELLRAVFLEKFHLIERNKQEVTIYYFDREKDFRAYVPAEFGKKGDYAGFYTNTADRAVIFLQSAESWGSTREIIFHEYIHHMFRISGENPPVWLDEGMAELFSTIRQWGDGMELGQPSAGRLYQLSRESLTPLERLFGVDHQSSVFRSGEHTGLFYAQAWALLHYWYFSIPPLPASQVDGFISFARQPRNPSDAELRAAFRKAFGMDYPEMLRRLEGYIQTGRYASRKLPLPAIAAAASYDRRAVTRDEARVRLAELALRTNRSPAAKVILMGSAEANPADPRPNETLGGDALREQNEAAARERWQRALEAGTRNPAIYREYSLIESRAWFTQFDLDFRMPEETAGRLRRLLVKSIEFAPQQSLAYELLAYVEAFAAKPSVGNINLVQRRYPELLRKSRTLLALAVVHWRANDNTTALGILDAIEKMQPDSELANCAELTRARIENRQPRSINPKPSPQAVIKMSSDH